MADHNQFPSFQATDFGIENTYAYSPFDDDHTQPSQSHTHSTSGSTSSTTTGAKRARRKTSKVWEHFDVEYFEVDGVRGCRAKCKRAGCTSVLSMKSGGGTGHLQRHVDAHNKKDGEPAVRQSTLKYNPDGSVRNFSYDPALQREALCRLIAANDLPLGFGESTAFTEYIQTAHTPNFKPVSRQTTTRDMKKLCKNGLKKIKEDFTTCTFSVSLTSDIWSGRAKQDYISVVAHYVDEKWELQKRIIRFELIDVAHTGENIAEAIVKVVEDFGLTSKIFAVTLDNASSNTSAMNILTPLFSEYAASFLLHQRCACHIINLIAKCVLKRCKAHIDTLRTAISFLGASNLRLANYERYCIALGATPHKYNLDMPVRWNSTYMMLKSLLPDKDAFSGFVNANYGTQLITPENWHVAEVLTMFLEMFYDATVSLSGVYYPTSPLMVHNILEIATHLKAYENDPILLEAVTAMKLKYLKYWREIPLLYAFAFILDPRAKLDGFGNALAVLAGAVNVDYASYCTDVRDKLSEIYGKYEQKYAGVRMQRPPPAPTAGKKKGAWNKIFGSSSSASSSSTGATAAPVLLGGGELAKYLNSDKISFTDDDEFNILQWWHDHKLTYPVLSILARDVLSVPVSTVSSESAFSLAGRILEERRTSLTPDMVKTLMTVKDGELARMRAQHTTDNIELASTFQNLAIHEEEPEE